MGTMCLVHIQFWGPVRADPIFGAVSWVCPYHLVSWFISEKWWWKVLIVPPVTKFWHKHHEDQSSPVQYLRRNCVLSFPYRQSEGFCTVSARLSSAAIKCSLRAEETCRHIRKFLERFVWAISMWCGAVVVQSWKTEWMLCNKCRQGPPREGDTWCIPCSAWESVAVGLQGRWVAGGLREAVGRSCGWHSAAGPQPSQFGRRIGGSIQVPRCEASRAEGNSPTCERRANQISIGKSPFLLCAGSTTALWRRVGVHLRGRGQWGGGGRGRYPIQSPSEGGEVKRFPKASRT